MAEDAKASDKIIETAADQFYAQYPKAFGGLTPEEWRGLPLSEKLKKVKRVDMAELLLQGAVPEVAGKLRCPKCLGEAAKKITPDGIPRDAKVEERAASQKKVAEAVAFSDVWKNHGDPAAKGSAFFLVCEAGHKVRLGPAHERELVRVS